METQPKTQHINVEMTSNKEKPPENERPHLREDALDLNLSADFVITVKGSLSLLHNHMMNFKLYSVH